MQVSGEVVANERSGAYRTLTTTAPGIPGRFRPGQFVTLAVGGQRSEMVSRRAFSIYQVSGRDAHPTEGGGAVEGGGAAEGAGPGVRGPGGEPAGPVTRPDTVRIVVGVHGPGTAWLAGLPAGAPVDVVGPLGRGFSLPGPGARCVLVGGGYGAAPLFSLAQRLAEGQCRAELVLGASTAERVFGVGPAVGAGPVMPVTVMTEDGSLGRRGLVTDVLPELLPGAAAVYACGPMSMLKAVTAVAVEHATPVQVAVEEAMACGIGVCMTCVLPVVGRDGRTRMTRSCIEGPVFDGTRVRWDEVGTIPADAVGAS